MTIFACMCMFQAAKRGLDTINAVAQEKAGTDPTRFIVAGPSKVTLTLTEINLKI